MHVRTATPVDRRDDDRPPIDAEVPGSAEDRTAHVGRVRYRPGLTGLRAIAVVGIALAAADHAWIPGGRVAGLEVLFVLSGYLTVAKLAGDRPPTAAAALRGLAIRARRILPALLTLLGGVSLLALASDPSTLYPLGADIRAALLGVGNWHQIRQATQVTGASSTLAHLWALAVGVQLTVVVTAVVVAVLSPRGRALVRSGAVVLALMSAVTLAVAVDGAVVAPRLLFGTDTRASGLLLGAALALAVRPTDQDVSGIRGRRLRAFALVAVVGVFVTMLLGNEGAGWIGRGGPLLTDLLAVAVIAGVVRGAPLGVLGAAAVQWVGLRSFALFLWHWPVIVALGGPAAVSRPLTTAVYVLAVVALADLTYRFVEVPLGAAWRSDDGGTVVRTGVAVAVAALACGAACAAALLTSPSLP